LAALTGFDKPLVFIVALPDLFAVCLIALVASPDLFAEVAAAVGAQKKKLP